MRTVFLWFYCLPIADALVLILLATLAFLFLRDRYGKTVLWKAIILLLLLTWISVIFFGTLVQRTESKDLSEPILIPFHSYYTALTSGSRELYRTNFMNTVLFYPAGLLVSEILPKRWNRFWKLVLVTCLFALMSIAIEYSQFRYSLGLAETDDVIHNTMGAIFGCIVCITAWQHKNKPINIHS